MKLNLDKRSLCGHGEGYCYWVTPRFIHVISESLEVARMMCVTSLPLRRTRPYVANPRRTHFVFFK